MLLHERLTLKLRGARFAPAGESADHTFSFADIPLVPDGEEPNDRSPEAIEDDRLGRKNWGWLWEVAEQIKIGLCKLATDAGDPGDHPRPASSGSSEVIWEGLMERSLSIQCSVTESWRRMDTRLNDYVDEKKLRRFSLNSILAGLVNPRPEKIKEDVVFRLEDACTYPLEDIDRTNGGRTFTVKEGILGTIRELVSKCKKEWPDLIVLAGSGCRLPLVAQLMKENFPARDGREPRVCSRPEDLEFAKRRVANGMATFLALERATSLGRHLARSVDVLHRPLGIVKPAWEGGTLRSVFVAVIEEGTEYRSHRWYPFSFRPAQIVRSPSGQGRLLPIFTQDWRHGQTKAGVFDLDRPSPGEGDAGCVRAPLPDAGGDDYKAEMRIDDLDRIFLRVTVQGTCYGPYQLETSDDIETLLLG
jgi:hypothetical protein